MTILLGATFALLLAAVVLSFQGMKDGVRNAPQEEIERLRSQVDQLRIEQDRLQLEKQLQQMRSNPVPETAGPSDIEKMKAELAAKDSELARLAEEKADAEKKAETFREEAGFIGGRELAKNDNELRRATMIRNALLIAKVREYESSPEYGSFITLEVVMPEHVQEPSSRSVGIPESSAGSRSPRLPPRARSPAQCPASARCRPRRVMT
jgi:outer membrane murein-binding lipoprotein Lpp